MATLAKFFENYSGIVLGGISSIVFLLLVDPSYSAWFAFIKALPQLTTCVFGFLLALLGIILQSEGQVLTAMKKSPVFKSLVGYNQKIVFLAFVITVVSLVVGYADFEWLCNLLKEKNLLWSIWGKKIALALFVFGLVWLVVDLFVFVRLFYKLIKLPK